MFKVISQHRAGLSRQVKEAVQTRRRGGSLSILNSRTKFNCCHIPWFVIEEEEKFKKRRDMEDDGNTWKETRELEIIEKMRKSTQW